ncbi:sugar phosphate nucleotidyltransferase, partial [Escherichia coli]|uniref:sugar phosphate nucleotidyltransferase n=3 Tax=Enterobacterales TaxID=91347 RepID=UPI00201A8D35
VTFGIVPTSPETGYGYIKTGEVLSNTGQDGYKVAAFVEKPKLELAKEYLTDGGYLWNSGMFMFKASVFINELKKFRPDILTACQN